MRAAPAPWAHPRDAEGCSSVDSACSGYLSSYEDLACTSRPVAALAADGSGITLRQALLPLVEECLADASAEDAAASPAPGAAGPGVQADQGGAEGGRPAGTDADAEAPPEPAEAEASSCSHDGVVVPGSPGAAEPSSTPANMPVAEAASAAEEARAAGRTPVPAAAAAVQTAAGEVLERAAAARGLLICGTAPPLDAPLAWLHAQMHAADHFLYVVLHLGRALAASSV